MINQTANAITVDGVQITNICEQEVTTIAQPQPELFQQIQPEAVNQQPLTQEMIQQMFASGKIQVAAPEQQAMSNKGFFNMLGKLGHKVPQQLPEVQQKEEVAFAYEYVEITDLCLPKLTAEEKVKAIHLANEIEKLKVSINERGMNKIVVSDTELDNLDRLVAEFKRTTHETLFGQMRLATRGGRVKVKGCIEAVEAKTVQLVDDVQSATCDVVDGVVDLGKETLDFAGVAVKGVITIGGTATKGLLKAGFNLIK